MNNQQQRMIMSLIFNDGVYMTQNEIKLNQVRQEGRRAFRLYQTHNPYKGVDEVMAAAWNDGWLQVAEEQRLYYEYY